MNYTADQIKDFVSLYESSCKSGMDTIDAFREVGLEYGQRPMWAMIDELMRRGVECSEPRTILMNGPKLLEWKELWDAMEVQFCGRELGENEWGFVKPEGENGWTPTTEFMWNDQLNCLPPRASGGGAFLVGEAWNHTSDTGEAVYACFACLSGKYFARYMTLKMFKAEIQRDTLPKAA